MDYTRDAVTAALEGRWKDAITANIAALKDHPKDPEILNRLGRAYLETGQKTRALETYQKVLKLDKFNNIAQKNILLLKNSRVNRGNTKNDPQLPPAFLEEPGVTKTVSLIRLGDNRVISQLHPGVSVKILCRQHAVCITNANNDYIGRLPDDLASRLRSFLKAGNTYAAWIRSIDLGRSKNPDRSIKVFIRELSRVAKYKLTPSFPLTEKLTYAAFTPPELIHEEKPDVSATEDQEESAFSREGEVEPEPESAAR